MSDTWDQARVEQYIVQGTEESLILDYKAAGALAKSDSKRTEITKDVSAQDPFGNFFRNDPFRKQEEPKRYVVYQLKIKMRNIGNVYAQYAVASQRFPCILNYYHGWDSSGQYDEPFLLNLQDLCVTDRDNTVRDVLKGGGYFAMERGPARHVPILPQNSIAVEGMQLTEFFERIDWKDASVERRCQADNAPPNIGSIRIKDIEIVDHQNQPEADDD